MLKYIEIKQNTLLNNPWIKEEIATDIRKYFKLNDEHVPYPKLCAAAKEYLERNL